MIKLTFIYNKFTLLRRFSALHKGGANACGEFKKKCNGLLDWLDVMNKNGRKWIIQKLLGFVLQADYANQYYPPRQC